MDIITIILLIILLLKTLSILNGIKWVKIHGPTYRLDLKKVKPKTNFGFYRLFETHNGNIFPFGLKDYILYEYYEKIKDRKGIYHPYTISIYVFRSWLYRFLRFTLVVFVYILIAFPFNKNFIFCEQIHVYLILTLSIILILDNILLSIETTYSFVNLGGYAYHYHMKPSRDRISELKVIIHRLLGTIGAGTIAFYVSYIYFNALEGKIWSYDQASTIITNAAIYFQCTYFTVTTLLTIGYGDIIPSNLIGQVITFMLEIQSFALLIIVLSFLFSPSSE